MVVKEKTDLLNLKKEEIRGILAALNERPFHASQIFKWLYRGINDFDEMTDISKPLKSKLKESYYIGVLKTVERKISRDGLTRKYLFLLQDGNIIECVLMSYKHGMSVCLSTQVGCKMGCRFCASTKGGLIRNLSPGEMTAQVLAVNRDLAKVGKPPISNIVLMGSGEPLDNYDNTIKFLSLVHDPDALNLSYRNITLSTCGLVPQIQMLADEGMPVNLAVSLHAPNQAVRQKIMPGAYKYHIDDIISAAKTYFNKTGRRVTFEYALIRNINDGKDHANELAGLLKGFPCHVNIIPLNKVRESGLLRSNDDSIAEFMDILRKKGINATRRRELGLDIDGACGQLRASYITKGRD